ncbi:uncharacterized protein cubi_01866 [Cryptosporidium ubiquitum]|uniref:Uncharacterized protein n=1 Tax=Cryptosporidium ubiquitum TaxID=857276 RepID=A0A1J4MM75_9CRYT|nr:uncharacterized protein cubi_01866 [Cryptosporidium ubiquitum]OII75345.1 hypothetical protein cubi_01866 [Cryptosporidium ubiquitum]
MSNYEERIEISGQTQISEINYIGKNSLSYFINPRSTLSGMYLDIESKYFTRNENILNNNSIRMKQLHISDRGCESEIWLTLPLVFPIATLHSVTHQRESQFCESNGGTLCFSPEETNISRLFSTIQGLSDIGAGFFQMVIAKFKGVVAEDIEVIKNEFGRIFKDESSSINGFIPFKPVGWRKRSFSKMNSTIPIEVNAIVRGTMINKQDSYYNAILISENYTESCKENIIKLGKLSNKFLEKIKFIYPSLEIIKVSDLEKDSFFEVTIRTEPMPSYVSSKGEDFDSKDKKFSLFQNSSEINNLKSIYLGDIRLINPYKTEVDTRIPCGLFKTFALISNHSIFEQSECRMATYIPFSQNRKKKSSQINYENSTETVPNSSNSIHQSQISDVVQYKISTPKLLTFGNHNKETSIKTPPPSNFFTNNSNCVSNISTCDLGYSTVFNSNWGGKSYSCTPTTKSSLNKISYTPFSSTEIDSSSWVSADFNIESTSIFSFEQDNQHFIPPRISSLNYMSNLCSNESINYSNNKLLYSNFISEKSSYEPIKNFDNNHLDVTQNSSDNNGLNLIKEAKELNINEIREPVFRNEKKSNKNQTIDIDENIEFFEYDCSQYLENKDFDILNMLENIFSDNSVTNLENRKMGCNNHHFNDFENVNGNGKLSEKKTNQSLGKDYGEKLNLWSFELNNSSICIGKTGSDLRQKGKVSEFVPNELNYLNDHILFGQ